MKTTVISHEGIAVVFMDPRSEPGMTENLDSRLRGNDGRTTVARMTEKNYNKTMQFQVPQFIETEDKLVGPLTLRQFIYVAVAGGLFAMLYFMVQTWLALLLGIILLGAAGALAFVKVEGRPLIDVILAAVGFYWKPQTYVWQQEHPVVEVGEGRREKGEGEGFSLEKIMAGIALHKKWEVMQTGEKIKPEKAVEKKMDSRYLIFERRTGERRAARRVDYR